MLPGFVTNLGMKSLGKTMGLMAMKGVAGDPTMRYITSVIKGVPGGMFTKAKSAISSNAADAPNVPTHTKTPYRSRQQNRIPAAALNNSGGGNVGGDPTQQMVGELQNIQGMLQGIDSNISSLNQSIDDLNYSMQNIADGNYNNANKTDGVLSALEELQSIIGENGANAGKSARETLESMVETRNHIQNVASGIVRPINKNLINMTNVLERIANASESMLKIQKYAYGLNDGADIKASYIRRASKRLDPSDSRSMDKEKYNQEMLENQKKNVELQMNEEEDSLLYRLYKVTKDTSKSIVKTLAKDTIGLGKDVVKGTWKHIIRPFAEDKIGLIKTKIEAKREEKQKEMMDVYTQMIKNGDHESAKKLQTKLEKKGISESVLNLVAGKGISSDQAEAYMERLKTKNKTTAFDNETRDAIVKGIPFLLSEILKAISGEEKVWNHEMDTLTSKDDYIKSKTAAAKQNLLDLQKSKKKNWWWSNKGMLEHNRNLNKGMSEVNRSEAMAENNMGIINLYDNAHETIEKEYKEKGIKNQSDKYKYLKNISGMNFRSNLMDVGRKIGKGFKAAKNWTKEVATGEYETEDHDAKGLFKRITDNDVVKMKSLLKSSGLDKEQEREALKQMMGSRNSNSVSLLSKMDNINSPGVDLSYLEDNTYENNVLLKEIIEILNNWRLKKGTNKKQSSNINPNNQNNNNNPLNSLNNQNNNNHILKINPNDINVKHVEDARENNISNTIERSTNVLYKILGALGGNFKEAKIENEEEKRNKEDNKKENKSSIFGLLKDKEDNKNETKGKKEDHKNLKIIAKHITSLDKETKKHNKWQRTKNFFDKILGIGSGIISSLGSVLGGIMQSGAYIVTGLGSLLLGKKLSGGIGNLFKGKGLGKGAAKFAKGAAKMGLRAIPVVGAIATAGFAAYDGYKAATDDEAIKAQTGRQEITAKDRVKHGVAGAAAGLVNWIPGLDGVTATSVTNTGEKMMNFITGKGWNTNKEVDADPNKGEGQTMTMIKSFMESLKSFGLTIFEGIKDIGKSMGESISNGLTYLRENFGSIVKSIVSGIWDMGKWIVTNIGSVFLDVLKWFGGEIWKTVEWLGSGIWDGLKWVGNWIWDSITGLGNSIAEKFSAFGTWISEGISSIGDSIMGGISSTIDSVKSWFSGIFGFISDSLGGLMEPIRTIGKYIIEGVTSIIDSIGGTFRRIGEMIWEPVKWLKNLIWFPIQSIIKWIGSDDKKNDTIQEESKEVSTEGVVKAVNFAGSEIFDKNNSDLVENANTSAESQVNLVKTINSDNITNPNNEKIQNTTSNNAVNTSINKKNDAKVENISVTTPINTSQNNYPQNKDNSDISMMQLDALNKIGEELSTLNKNTSLGTTNNNTTNNNIINSGNNTMTTNNSSPINYSEPTRIAYRTAISNFALEAAKS